MEWATGFFIPFLGENQQKTVSTETDFVTPSPPPPPPYFMTSPLLLQFGWSLDWHRLVSLLFYTMVQAAYSFVIPATSQILSCNVHLHMLISIKVYSSTTQ